MMLVATPADTVPRQDRMLDRPQRRVAAYRAARRHSFVVRFLRLALPAGGALALAATVFISQIPSGENFDLSIAKTTIAKNAIIMDNPKLTGFDRYEREFRLEADRAIQKFATPDAVTLENIIAYISAPGRGPIAIEALAADFDNANGSLIMGGEVMVDSADGYGMALNGAKVNTKDGTLQSANPVTLTYHDSRTTGDALDAKEGGKHIVIEGNVRTFMMPPKREAPAAEPKQTVSRPGAPPETVTH